MQHDYKMFKGEWTDKNSIGYVSTSINHSFISVGYFGKAELNFNFFYHDYVNCTKDQTKKRFTDYLKFLRKLTVTFKKIIDLSKTPCTTVYRKEINEGSESCTVVYINHPQPFLRKLTIGQFTDVEIPAVSGIRLRNLLSKLIRYINLLITESIKFMLDQENYIGSIDNQIEYGKVRNGFKDLLAPKTPILTKLDVNRSAATLSEQFTLKHIVFHSDVCSLEDLNRTKEKYTRLINRLQLYRTKMEGAFDFEDIAFIGDFNETIQEASFIACRLTSSQVTLNIGDCFRRVEFGLSNYMEKEIVIEITKELIVGLTEHLNNVVKLANELTLPDTYKELEC